MYVIQYFIYFILFLFFWIYFPHLLDHFLHSHLWGICMLFNILFILCFLFFGIYFPNLDHFLHSHLCSTCMLFIMIMRLRISYTHYYSAFTYHTFTYVPFIRCDYAFTYIIRSRISFINDYAFTYIVHKRMIYHTFIMIMPSRISFIHTRSHFDHPMIFIISYSFNYHWMIEIPICKRNVTNYSYLSP